MFGTHDFLLFVAAGLLLNITPGPDMLYVVGRSTTQGVRAGAAAALGIGAGCLVHITAAALGVSAAIAASATAFTVLKLCGAAYLLYVGVSLLFAPRSTQTSATTPRMSASITMAPASNSEIFMQGFLTNALNPKVALFFLAFVPQFISTDSTQPTLAFFFLGLVFNLNGTLWNLLVAWTTAKAGVRWRSSRFAAWMNRCIGIFFVFLGVKLALAKAN
jgi:threonine/homoserine/homoserine lactone efflux protein